MPKAIKYETTNIDPAKTASEIVALIVKYGGSRTSIEWDGGVPKSISFVIRDSANDRDVPVHLEARTDSVHRLLAKREPFNAYRRKTRQQYEEFQREQAARIVWRHLKDLIEQQLLAVEIGQYDLREVFLHGLVVRTGAGLTTMGELLQEADPDQIARALLPAPTATGREIGAR